MTLLLPWLWSAECFAQVLPPSVPDRVGRAASWVYNWTSAQYATKLNTRDVIWDNTPTSRQGGSGKFSLNTNSVFSGGYTAVNRIPIVRIYGGNRRLPTGCSAPGGGCTLAWFRANHPSWIIYKSDQRTPAYMFDDLSMIPLDISNPDVQAFFKTNLYSPVLNAGYHAISVDNVGSRNSWGESGVCSIAPTTNCTADGGKWTQLYTGAIIGDAAFAKNRIAWAQAITAYARSFGKSSMGNVYYESTDAINSANLVNAFDIWYDEDGYTGDTTPSPCTPKNPSGHVGPGWISKMNFITNLNAGAGPKAHISENSICPVGAWSKVGAGSNFDMVEFAVASYLIGKGSHGYLLWFFSNGAICDTSYFCDNDITANWPQFWLHHGPAAGRFTVTGNVYHRNFAKALALVNPSIAMTFTYDLGSNVHHRSNCTRYTGKISLPPMTGMVLINGEPTGCTP